MQDYGSASYWDERYAEVEEVYDWYQDYSTLRPFLKPYLKENDREFEILIPGCGNSRLAIDLYTDDFVNITNIDISSVVISQMSDMYRDKHSIEYIVGDARKLEGFPNNCFNLIIDKGLFDSLLCSELDNILSAKQYLREMYRMLKPGGYFIMVSHGSPDTRLGYLRKGAKWLVDHRTIVNSSVENGDNESKEHYIFNCLKQ